MLALLMESIQSELSQNIFLQPMLEDFSFFILNEGMPRLQKSSLNLLPQDFVGQSDHLSLLLSMEGVGLKCLESGYSQSLLNSFLHGSLTFFLHFEFHDLSLNFSILFELLLLFVELEEPAKVLRLQPLVYTSLTFINQPLALGGVDGDCAADDAEDYSFSVDQFCVMEGVQYLPGQPDEQEIASHGVQDLLPDGYV